jgi:predicted MPP superfamily phosphohydrolase
MFFVVTLLLAIVPSWITYAWAVSSFPWVARRRRAFAVTLASLPLVGGPLQWIVAHTHSTFAGGAQAAIAVLFVTMGMTSIPLGLLHALLHATLPQSVRRPSKAGRKGTGATEGDIARRQIVEAGVGFALFGAAGSAVGWGMVRGRHAFEVRELAVRIQGLPRALDGYVIAQISDIHTGTHVGERELDEGLSLVRRARPDLVVVTGDLVDFDATFAPFIGRKLADLPARDGIFACLGNHDYYAGAESVVQALRAAGITPLVDEGRVLRASDGGGFALLGVDDVASKRYGRSGPHLTRALSMVPPELPRILLSHQPPTVDAWAGQVALQLSGHTHGGQINPGGRTVNFLFEYVAGAYAVGATTLYVNRGFGTVGPPVRVGVPPEVTRIILVAG